MRSGPTPRRRHLLDPDRFLCARCTTEFLSARELVAHTHEPGACPHGDA